MSALVHSYLCGPIAVEWLMIMKEKRFWTLAYPITIIAVLLSSFWFGKNIAVFSENFARNKDYCIIIDPGHGGPDGGATSCAGILESRYNLEIALKLEQILHLLGHKTKMIRREDISVYTEGNTISQKKISDLTERARIVNETQNAILISIHQNTFPDPRYSGPQVFYGNISGSEILASNLQKALNKSLDLDNGRNTHECKGIYLMEHINCVGVLIECGFLSNVQEEAKLRNPTYQKKLCSVIATEVGSFLSNA